MIAQATSTVQCWFETRIEFLSEPVSFWRHPGPSWDIDSRDNIVIHLWSVPRGEYHPIVSELETKEGNLL